MNKAYPYVPAIDGLRAIAVLAVLIYHLDAAFLPGGFAGVDVFFVISGYVVARSLVSRSGESFGQFLMGFYSRRIRRIVPALILCLLVTALFTVLFIPDSWLSSTTHQVGLYAFFGLSNFALVWFQDDYFSPRAEFNPFVHTWSLGVEEQFYFVFPLLIFLWFRFRHHSVGILPALGKALLPLLAVASFITAYYLSQHRPDWAFYMLPARFWEMAAGVMLFQLQAQNRVPTLGAAAADRVLLVGLLVIAAGYAWADPAAFPYPWAILPVTGSVLVIWAVTARALPAHRQMAYDRYAREQTALGLARLLTWRPVLYAGKTSYSLYLWHWPVFTLLRWTTGMERPQEMALGLLMTVALASASYHWVETPIRRARPLAAPAYRAVAVGLVAIVVLWAGAAQLFERRPQLTLSATGDTYVWYPYAYSAGLPVSTASDPGLRGRQLFVVGNSHTGAYATMVSLLEQQTGVRTHLRQVGECAFGNLLHSVQDKAGCAEVVEEYFDYLHQHARPGDMVLLASLRTYRLSDQWYRKEPADVLAYSQSDEARRHLEEARQETDAIVRRLGDMGLLVMIDAPKPVLKAPVYRCSDWFNRHNPVCVDEPGIDRSFMEDLRTPVMRSMELLAAEHSHVALWDPLPALCGESECAAFSATGEPLYFDGDHLSGHGNRVLYPSFAERLSAVYQTCTDCPVAVEDDWTPSFDRPIVSGKRVSFVQSGHGAQYLGEGWSTPEPWGVWSSGETAKIFLPVQEHRVRSIRVEAQPFITDLHTEQHIHLLIDGIDVGTVILDAQSRHDFEVAIPEEVSSRLQETALMVLELRLPHAISPAAAGLNQDSRQLALGLKALTVF